MGTSWWEDMPGAAEHVMENHFTTANWASGDGRPCGVCHVALFRDSPVLRELSCAGTASCPRHGN